MSACPRCGQLGWVASGDGWCKHTHDGQHLWTGSGFISPLTRCSCGLRLGDFQRRAAPECVGTERSSSVGEHKNVLEGEQ